MGKGKRNSIRQAVPPGPSRRGVSRDVAPPHPASKAAKCPSGLHIFTAGGQGGLALWEHLWHQCCAEALSFTNESCAPSTAAAKACPCFLSLSPSEQSFTPSVSGTLSEASTTCSGVSPKLGSHEPLLLWQPLSIPTEGWHAALSPSASQQSFHSGISPGLQKR